MLILHLCIRLHRLFPQSFPKEPKHDIYTHTQLYLVSSEVYKTVDLIHNTAAGHKIHSQSGRFLHKGHNTVVERCMFLEMKMIM